MLPIAEIAKLRLAKAAAVAGWSFTQNCLNGIFTEGVGVGR